MRFEDHFSAMAQAYARHRPTYPDELFAYLASAAPGTWLAWDCGTGNGQAAVQLARHFMHVVATDASAEQLSQAPRHPRIEYRVELAKEPSLPDGSTDLITVAQAVHWFDLDIFYPQVRRVLAPGGVLAVWTYAEAQVTPEIDQIAAHYTFEILEGYWPEKIHYVFQHYQNLPFPFEELDAPPLQIEAEWELGQLSGFYDSWSATRRFKNENGQHPLELVWNDLTAAWGDPGRKRKVRWPLYLRVGRKEVRK